MKPYYLLSIALLSLVPTYGAIIINLDYGATSEADIATYGASFDAAEAYWESQLTGYRDGAFAPSAVTIEVNLSNIDGVGGTLGSAGSSVVNIQGSFMETTEGAMTFDTSDIGSLVTAGTFDAVILHEMAHVLGFGTLWSGSSATGLLGFQEVYVNGTGQYTGAAALATFQTEFDQPGAAFIPIELDGGSGTANGHWNMGVDLGVNEAADSRDDPGDTIVYTSVNNGLSLDNELMSGFLSGTWLSETTLQSFYDIGYETVLAAPVPEPSSIALFMGMVCMLRLTRRRRT